MSDSLTKRKLSRLKKQWIGMSIAVLGIGGAGLMHAIHPVHADSVNMAANPGTADAASQPEQTAGAQAQSTPQTTETEEQPQTDAQQSVPAEDYTAVQPEAPAAADNDTNVQQNNDTDEEAEQPQQQTNNQTADNDYNAQPQQQNQQSDDTQQPSTYSAVPQSTQQNSAVAQSAAPQSNVNTNQQSANTTATARQKPDAMAPKVSTPRSNVNVPHTQIQQNSQSQSSAGSFKSVHTTALSKSSNATSMATQNASNMNNAVSSTDSSISVKSQGSSNNNFLKSITAPQLYNAKDDGFHKVAQAIPVMTMNVKQVGTAEVPGHVYERPKMLLGASKGGGQLPNSLDITDTDDSATLGYDNADDIPRTPDGDGIWNSRMIIGGTSAKNTIAMCANWNIDGPHAATKYVLDSGKHIPQDAIDGYNYERNHGNKRPVYEFISWMTEPNDASDRIKLSHVHGAGHAYAAEAEKAIKSGFKPKQGQYHVVSAKLYRAGYGNKRGTTVQDITVVRFSKGPTGGSDTPSTTTSTTSQQQQQQNQQQQDQQQQQGGTVAGGGNGDSPANNPNNAAPNNSNPNNMDANNVIVPQGGSSNNNNLTPNGPVFNNVGNNGAADEDADFISAITNNENRDEQDGLNRMEDSAFNAESEAATSASTAASLSAARVSAEAKNMNASQRSSLEESAQFQSLNNKMAAESTQSSLANDANSAKASYMTRINADHATANDKATAFLNSLAEMHNLTPSERAEAFDALQSAENNYMNAANAANANDGTLDTNFTADLNSMEAALGSENGTDRSSEIARTDSAINLDDNYYKSEVSSLNINPAQKSTLDSEMDSLAADAQSRVNGDANSTSELNSLAASLASGEKSFEVDGSLDSATNSNTSRNSLAGSTSDTISSLQARLASEENSVNDDSQLSPAQKSEIDSALGSTEAAEEASLRSHMTGAGSNASKSVNASDSLSGKAINGLALKGLTTLPNGDKFGQGPDGFGLYSPSGKFLGNPYSANSSFNYGIGYGYSAPENTAMSILDPSLTDNGTIAGATGQLANGDFYGYGPEGYGLYDPNGLFIKPLDPNNNPYASGNPAISDERHEANGAFAKEHNHYGQNGLDYNAYTQVHRQKHGHRGITYIGYGAHGYGVYGLHGVLLQPLNAPTVGHSVNTDYAGTATGITTDNTAQESEPGAAIGATSSIEADNDAVEANAANPAQPNSSVEMSDVSSGNSEQHNNNDTLPQTGESSPNVVAEAGTAAAIAAMAMLATDGDRKRKRRKI